MKKVTPGLICQFVIKTYGLTANILTKLMSWKLKAQQIILV